jgi:hypothetical protein
MSKSAKRASVKSAVRKAAKSAKNKIKAPAVPPAGLASLTNQNQQLPVVGSQSSALPFASAGTQQPLGMGGPGKKFKNVRKAAKKC